MADPVKVKQIVYNLISNAVKFSPDGATVQIEARHLRRGPVAPRAFDSIQIAVIDHGIGIDPQHHRVIFEDFVQVDGYDVPIVRRHRARAGPGPPLRRAAPRHHLPGERPGRGQRRSP